MMTAGIHPGRFSENIIRFRPNDGGGGGRFFHLQLRRMLVKQSLEGSLEGARNAHRRLLMATQAAGAKAVLVLCFGAKGSRFYRRYHRFGRVGVREAG